MPNNAFNNALFLTVCPDEITDAIVLQVAEGLKVSVEEAWSAVTADDARALYEYLEGERRTAVKKLMKQLEI